MYKDGVTVRAIDGRENCMMQRLLCVCGCPRRKRSCDDGRKRVQSIREERDGDLVMIDDFQQIETDWPLRFFSVDNVSYSIRTRFYDGAHFNFNYDVAWR